MLTWLRCARAAKAFTLIELMIVVVIVAILAMVAVPIYRGNVTAARMTEGMAGVGMIRSAMRTYAASHDGNYPVGTASGAKLNESPFTLGIVVTDLEGRYFKDPATCYSVTSALTTYAITATEPSSGLKYELNEKGEEKTGTGYYSTGQ